MSEQLPADAQRLLVFWFGEENQKKWFNSTAEFDLYINLHFKDIWQQGLMGQLKTWEDSAKGALALTILLDQFPLNMYRNSEKAFATEALSRSVASRAIEKGFDQQVDLKERGFFYIPFMHSESLEDQNRSVELFEGAGLDTYWPNHHRDIIKRFGRFPHRNQLLGRESTQDELDWLQSDQAFKG